MSCEEHIENLRINQLQILGSHNSYRKGMPPGLQALLNAPPVPLPEDFNPQEWDYAHVPLEEQFDKFGIRSIELDVFYDPHGGLFYKRMGNGFLGQSPESHLEALKEPGLKVLHYPDFDYETHCLTFKDALVAVKKWSESHPGHLPLIIMVEPKEDNPAEKLPGLGLTNIIPFDKAALTSIDQEIKSVFGEKLEQVITPDQVRRQAPTLNEAVRMGFFPTLKESRGKILFVMLPSGNELLNYLDGHESLRDRVMFAFSQPGKPETAFLNYNDPKGKEEEIRRRVGEGYIVRTRSDADTQEARIGDFSKWEAALSSGAQIISTDYYQPDARFGLEPGWSDYYVKFLGRALALVNPINGGEKTDGCLVLEPSHRR